MRAGIAAITWCTSDSDHDPGIFYRFDVQKKQLLRIAAQYPLLESQSLASVEPIRYAARDGAEIPGYLTRSVRSTGPTRQL